MRVAGVVGSAEGNGVRLVPPHSITLYYPLHPLQQT
jgi:hypothetical protein